MKNNKYYKFKTVPRPSRIKPVLMILIILSLILLIFNYTQELRVIEEVIYPVISPSTDDTFVSSVTPIE